METQQPMQMSEAGAFEDRYFADIYRAAYDARNPRYKHRSYVHEVLSVSRPGARLLDIGCAYGAFIREAKAQFDCDGCDISHHAVQMASERYPDQRFFVSAIEELSSASKYEVITCFDILEHVPEVGAALEHLHDVLEPGGLLVATMPVYDTVVGKGVGLLDRDPTHVHKNSRYWWQELFTQHGYELIHWKGIMRFYFGRGLYLHWCHSSIRRFAPAILIAARNPRQR